MIQGASRESESLCKFLPTQAAKSQGTSFTDTVRQPFSSVPRHRRCLEINKSNRLKLFPSLARVINPPTNCHIEARGELLVGVDVRSSFSVCIARCRVPQQTISVGRGADSKNTEMFSLSLRPQQSDTSASEMSKLLCFQSALGNRFRASNER
jgi:hypothetical protein